MSLAALIAFVVLLCGMVARVNSAYSAVAKPLEFYLHNFDIPVSVAGLQAKYVMNTTRLFKFLTQQDAYANSFYKPVGLPKIDVGFYLYPNFAGPVTINGQWQVFLWVNGSAYKPTVFSLDFQEITVGGDLLWDSGALNPTVTSTIAQYTDVPVYNYNLLVTLSHNFTAGTTLHVQAEVNAGSSADTRIWYDSPLYPSKVILPAQDYARASSIKTYAYDNSEISLFYYNWSDNQRIVIVRANVTDPFGGYDVFKVNSTIFDPTGHAVINNTDMTRVTDGQWMVGYSHVYEINWTYSTNATLGDYTVIVTVIDNNGYYRNIDEGSYSPFIEEGIQIFTIGIIVYYDPSFLITDDLNDPLPSAQVYITWRNGTTDTFPRYTSGEGFINLMGIVATSNIGFTILWKDIIVQQTTVQINSNGPYTIKTRVYQLTVQVNANNGATINGAYVVLYGQSGAGYALKVTDAIGHAIFKMPEGTYRIDVNYATNYWLTAVNANASDTIQLEESTVKNMILSGFPPAVWSTVGFLLLLVTIIVTALIVISIWLVARARATRTAMSQRLATIEELGRWVGHDLRNPLTGISGAIYYLKKRYGASMDDKGMEMVNTIEAAIAYSDKIVKDLLEYSEKIKLDLQEATPQSLVRDALSIVKLPENVKLIDLTEDQPRIMVDVGRLKRVFVIVIKNAVEAMPEGGKLTIKSTNAGDSVRFSCSDTGVGMSKEMLEKIWSPLFTTKAKGMGFGLPVCKRFIEAHGGSISVESILGKGTTFIISIPIRA
jgi:signal transduction histidine kinase